MSACRTSLGFTSRNLRGIRRTRRCLRLLTVVVLAALGSPAGVRADETNVNHNFAVDSNLQVTADCFVHRHNNVTRGSEQGPPYKVFWHGILDCWQGYAMPYAYIHDRLEKLELTGEWRIVDEDDADFCDASLGHVCPSRDYVSSDETLSLQPGTYRHRTYVLLETYRDVRRQDPWVTDGAGNCRNPGLDPHVLECEYFQTIVLTSPVPLD